MIDMIVAVKDWINAVVWGVSALLLILFTGVFYTVRLGFVQFRHPVKLFRQTVVKAFQKEDCHDRKPGQMTSFQVAMTSVGAIPRWVWRGVWRIPLMA